MYLLRNLSSLGKPMIIVLVEGRPRILPQSVIASANAIIHAYLPGPRTFSFTDFANCSHPSSPVLTQRMTR